MRFIDSIEAAGRAEAVCIQVAAADSLYVTEDYLLTHNTLNDVFIILDEAQNTTPESTVRIPTTESTRLRRSYIAAAVPIP